MGSQAVIKATSGQCLFDLWADFAEVAIIVEVLHVLVIRDIAADSRIS